MSPTWTIDALHVGTARNVPAELIHFHDLSHMRIDVPMIMFVLRNGEETIIVDTGAATDPDRVRDLHGFEWECAPELHPENQLARIGVPPGSAGAIVHTHLHWDHCANNHVAPDAPIYVQDAELQYAVHPCIANRATYEVLPDVAPPWAGDLHRFVPVHGEFELRPGVTLIPLPGHSPGSQGVVVETADGPHVITGDCLDSYDNWGSEEPDSVRPSGGFTNLIDFYDSLLRLKRSGWIPVPSHDFRVLEKGRFG